MEMDEFRVQIDGAVLDKKIDSSIKKQLSSISGLSINVDSVILGTNAIKNIKDTLAKHKIDLQLNLGNTSGIQSQVQQTVNNIQKSVVNGLKSLSTLKTGTSPIDAVLNKNGLVNVEQSLNKIKNIYSEFGKVKITNKLFDNEGNIEKFKVNIEQVNGDLKETRSFMMALNGTSFAFPNDVIKGAESYVHHLNEAKNITNKTGDALNQEKLKLDEQNKYYSKQSQAIKDVWGLKTKLLSADKLETVELQKQLKTAERRVKYNQEQINKNGLSDTNYTRNNADLDYELSKRYEIVNAKKQDIAVSKELAQTDKIQYSVDIGENDAKIAQLTQKTKLWGDEVKRVDLNMDGVNNAYTALKNSKSDEEKITNAKELQKQYDIVGNKLKQMSAIDISPEKRMHLSNQMTTWLQKNSNAAKLCGDDIQRLAAECKTCDNVRFNGIKSEFEGLTNQARVAGKLGNSLIGTFKTAVSKFAGWGIASTAVMMVVSSIKQAFTELKEVDTILTEIAKTSDRTTQSLIALGESAVQSANRYGATISGYLKGVQEMSRAGFGEEQSEQLADLSSLTQSAGDMTADLANDYIIASDAAYGYAGNVGKLNTLLDGQNQVTNKNAVSMEELANATKVAANQLSNMGIEENELTAVLGTGIATSRESGETVGRAIKGIFMNLQQVKGETGFDGEILDEESLKKVEARCHSVGVELEYMKDGIATLRDPMEILKELADVYNSLPKDSADRAGIISDIGGKYRGNILSSILSNYDKVEKMLGDYENSENSALTEALKTAESWQGLLNQISNNWTGFIQNFAEDSLVTNTLKFINELVKGIDTVTDKTGILIPLITSIGAGMGIKNIGKRKMFRFINMPNMICVL